MEKENKGVRYTPENIESLGENEIFVFGSNALGRHIDGAARTAKEKFGAQEGVAEGLTGRAYAFPTLDKEFNRVDIMDFTLSMVMFLLTVRRNPQFTFYLTKVGCGIAGWDVAEVRKTFNLCAKKIFPDGFPRNLTIPKEFEE